MLLLPRTYHPVTPETDHDPAGGGLSGIVINQNQGPTVTLEPRLVDGDRNFAPNPSLEKDRVGKKPFAWRAEGDTGKVKINEFKVSSSHPSAGSKSLLVEATNRSDVNNHSLQVYFSKDRIPTPLGQAWTFAAKVYVDDSAMAGVYLGVEWYDKKKKFISDTQSGAQDNTGLKTLVYNQSAPTNAVWMKPYVGNRLGNSSANQDVRLYIDAVMALKGTFVLPYTTPGYFDGDTLDCRWDGTPGRSSSTKLKQVEIPIVDDDFRNGHVDADNSIYWQTFRLPSTYLRGEGDDAKVPRLNGLQLQVGVYEDYQRAATLDWRIEHYETGVGWVFLARGTAITTPNEGPQTWFNIYFDTPVEIEQSWVTNQDFLRFSVKGRDPGDLTVNQLVEYDGTAVTINNQSIAVIPEISSSPLQEGGLYPFDFNGVPSILYFEPGSEQVLYSVQQGVSWYWYTVTNPLSNSGAKLYQADGVTPIQDGGEDVSLMFRLLAETADDGTDFLGNNYRSLVTHNKVEFIDTFDPTAKSKFWLSKPNPSRFAVESLYFDLTTADNPEARVIDHVLLDPVTPGIVFHVYYSNDDSPGVDEETWENLLWYPVPKTFEANKRDTYAFPGAVTAKYIKVEFSHLQATSYSVSDFERPIFYKKYPQWVLDFFLLQQNVDLPTASAIEIVYDALDLAYNYYKEDITQEPDKANATILFDPFTKKQIYKFAHNPKKRRRFKRDFLNGADPITLEAIMLAFRPWINAPGKTGKKVRKLLSAYLKRKDLFDGNYPTEEITRSRGNVEDVSSLDRGALILEKTFPQMFFFIPCRHGYKEVLAKFEKGVAYHAGIREIAFTREEYYMVTDDSLYIEDGGDSINIERNDFELEDLAWVTSRDAAS